MIYTLRYNGTKHYVQLFKGKEGMFRLGVAFSYNHFKDKGFYLELGHVSYGLQFGRYVSEKRRFEKRAY